jgi:hypothetical protein
MVMLEDSSEWNPVILFERLNDFWERWCDGEFIDAAPENLPQEKMRLLREQMPDRSPALGLRQVDVFTGLNSLILLLSLHRYAQDRDKFKVEIHFYPSGQDIENKLTIRLSKVIYYNDCLGLRSFQSIVGHCLDRADLSGADLSGAYLSGADLSRADLSGANLSGAYLSGAYPIGANLSGADLSRANLSGAYLGGAYLSRADLEDIRWNAETSWEDITELQTARNVSEALKQQLGL